jgi:oxygen-independent coproporphyrinogen-3 oxidase
MLGLYIHVPFCSAICNYCNFNRGLFDADLKTRYVEAVIGEIRQAGLKACTTTDSSAAPPGVVQAFRPAAADTIYFGGGTPSLLEPDEIARIVEACESAFDVSQDREVTMEANPESVTEARLAAFRRAGVNRLSFGVQSFRGEELLRLSRLHSVDRARAGRRRSARRRLRQSQPRPHDVAARAERQRVARVGGRGDRARARASLALYARGLSERAAQGGDGSCALVAGPGR